MCRNGTDKTPSSQEGVDDASRWRGLEPCKLQVVRNPWGSVGDRVVPNALAPTPPKRPGLRTETASSAETMSTLARHSRYDGPPDCLRLIQRSIRSDRRGRESLRQRGRMASRTSLLLETKAYLVGTQRFHVGS